MKKYAILSIIVLYAIVHAESNVEKIIKQVQKKYRDIDVVYVDFKQVNRFKLTGIQNEVFGTLWISQDNKFRFETEDQVMVSNGDKFWRYNKLENQVIIDYAKKSQNDVFLNNFLFNISDHYLSQIVNEETVNKQKIFEIRLTPKNPDDSYFKYIKVWLVDKSWDLKKVVYVDFNENEVEYDIEKIDFNPKVSQNIFDFQTPEGVEVVDLRF
ncbi:MAG: outer membrane lipoprotein carrier protein LolA [Calditrichota bacterium]